MGFYWQRKQGRALARPLCASVPLWSKNHKTPSVSSISLAALAGKSVTTPVVGQGAGRWDSTGNVNKGDGSGRPPPPHPSICRGEPWLAPSVPSVPSVLLWSKNHKTLSVSSSFLGVLGGKTVTTPVVGQGAGRWGSTGNVNKGDPRLAPSVPSVPLWSKNHKAPSLPSISLAALAGKTVTTPVAGQGARRWDSTGNVNRGEPWLAHSVPSVPLWSENHTTPSLPSISLAALAGRSCLNPRTPPPPTYAYCIDTFQSVSIPFRGF